MSDRLTLTHAIEDAGIERDKAERIATVIFDAIHENVATKADVAPLATKADVAETKADILKWMVSSIGIQTVVIIGAVVAIARLLHG